MSYDNDCSVYCTFAVVFFYDMTSGHHLPDNRIG